MAQPSMARNKFASVNLNSSYGRPPSQPRQQPRPNPYGGMMVLGRGRSAGILPQKGTRLVIPRPVNLPSLKREHAGNDPTVNLVSGYGGGWKKEDERPASAPAASQIETPSLKSALTSGSTWAGPGSPVPESRSVNAQAVESFLTAPPARSGVYTPPGARLDVGSGSVLADRPAFLRREDFPSLKAAAPVSIPHPVRQKEANRPSTGDEGDASHMSTEPELPSQRQIDKDQKNWRSSGLRDGSEGGDASTISSDIQATADNEQQPHVPSQDPRDTRGKPNERSALDAGDNWRQRQTAPPRIASQHVREVRNWADDEREPARSGRPGSYMENSRSRHEEWGFGSADEMQYPPISQSAGLNQENMGGAGRYGMHDRRSMGLDNSRPRSSDGLTRGSIEGFGNGGGRDWDLGRGGPPARGYQMAEEGSRGVGGGKGNFRTGFASRTNDSMLSAGLDLMGLPIAVTRRVGIEPPPLSFAFEGKPLRKKKEEVVDAKFRDLEREAFEAELERLQQQKELDRQHKAEEELRAIEQARLEQEAIERAAREEEERRVMAELEAKEMAARAEREALELIKRQEDERRAAQEEKKRLAQEEETRLENARRKLMELEERIAKREAERLALQQHQQQVTQEVDFVPSVENGASQPDTEEQVHHSWEDEERSFSLERKVMATRDVAPSAEDAYEEAFYQESRRSPERGSFSEEYPASGAWRDRQRQPMGNGHPPQGGSFGRFGDQDGFQGAAGGEWDPDGPPSFRDRARNSEKFPESPGRRDAGLGSGHDGRRWQAPEPGLWNVKLQGGNSRGSGQDMPRDREFPDSAGRLGRPVPDWRRGRDAPRSQLESRDAVPQSRHQQPWRNSELHRPAANATSASEKSSRTPQEQSADAQEDQRQSVAAQAKVERAPAWGGAAARTFAQVSEIVSNKASMKEKTEFPELGPSSAVVLAVNVANEKDSHEVRALLESQISYGTTVEAQAEASMQRASQEKGSDEEIETAFPTETSNFAEHAEKQEKTSRVDPYDEVQETAQGVPESKRDSTEEQQQQAQLEYGDKEQGAGHLANPVQEQFRPLRFGGQSAVQPIQIGSFQMPLQFGPLFGQLAAPQQTFLQFGQLDPVGPLLSRADENGTNSQQQQQAAGVHPLESDQQKSPLDGSSARSSQATKSAWAAPSPPHPDRDPAAQELKVQPPSPVSAWTGNRSGLSRKGNDNRSAYSGVGAGGAVAIRGRTGPRDSAMLSAEEAVSGAGDQQAFVQASGGQEGGNAWPQQQSAVGGDSGARGRGMGILGRGRGRVGREAWRTPGSGDAASAGTNSRLSLGSGNAPAELSGDGVVLRTRPGKRIIRRKGDLGIATGGDGGASGSSIDSSLEPLAGMPSGNQRGIVGGHTGSAAQGDPGSDQAQASGPGDGRRGRRGGEKRAPGGDLASSARDNEDFLQLAGKLSGREEEDFIEVRSKRQQLSERREQREKESKARSKDGKGRESSSRSKSRGSSRGPPGNEHQLGREKSEGSEAVMDFAGSEKPSHVHSSPVGTAAAQDTQPSGTLPVLGPARGSSAVAVVSDDTSGGLSDSTRQNGQGTEAAAYEAAGASVGSQPVGKAAANVWGSTRSTLQVVSLVQIQLEEKIKPHLQAQQQPPAGAKNPEPQSNNASASGPVRALFAPDQIQFGSAATAPLLPNAPLPGLGGPSLLGPGDGRLGKHSQYRRSNAGGNVEMATASKPRRAAGRDPLHQTQQQQQEQKQQLHHLPQREQTSMLAADAAEAEAEAAASAVVAAAISSDESVGSTRHEQQQAPAGMDLSCVEDLLPSDADAFPEDSAVSASSSGAGILEHAAGRDPLLVDSMASALPADLSLEPSLAPDRPSSLIQPGAQNLPSGVAGIQKGGHPFSSLDVGPMLSTMFPFSSDPQNPFRIAANGEALQASLGGWSQSMSNNNRNLNPFYGGPGLPSPFLNPNSGSMSSGLQVPPPGLMYNSPFGPNQMSQLGMNYLPAYLPTNKQPDWKHTPIPLQGGSTSGMANSSELSGGLSHAGGRQVKPGNVNHRMAPGPPPSMGSVRSHGAQFDQGLSDPFQMGGGDNTGSWGSNMSGMQHGPPPPSMMGAFPMQQLHSTSGQHAMRHRQQLQPHGSFGTSSGGQGGQPGSRLNVLDPFPPSDAAAQFPDELGLGDSSTSAPPHLASTQQQLGSRQGSVGPHGSVPPHHTGNSSSQGLTSISGAKQRKTRPTPRVRPGIPNNASGDGVQGGLGGSGGRGSGSFGMQTPLSLGPDQRPTGQQVGAPHRGPSPGANWMANRNAKNGPPARLAGPAAGERGPPPNPRMRQEYVVKPSVGLSRRGAGGSAAGTVTLAGANQVSQS